MAARNSLFYLLISTLRVAATVLAGGCAVLPGLDQGLAPVVDRPLATAAAASRPAQAATPAATPSPAALVAPPMRERAAAPSPPAAAPRSADALFVALSTLGIDYQRGGRSRESGFDCSGLVAHVYAQAFGLDIPAHTQAQSSLGTPVELRQLEPGDLVFFNTLQRPNSHVGIYIGGRRFVHAPKPGSAVRIENLGNRYWITRFDGARRLLD